MKRKKMTKRQREIFRSFIEAEIDAACWWSRQGTKQIETYQRNLAVSLIAAARELGFEVKEKGKR